MLKSPSCSPENSQSKGHKIQNYVLDFRRPCKMKHENGASVSDYCGMMWRGSCKIKTLRTGMFLFLYLNKQWPVGRSAKKKNVRVGHLTEQEANDL